MKKLILAIILSVGLTITPTPHLIEIPEAQAADVVITVIIPSTQVSRVTTMVTNTLNCEELGPKACLTKELRTDIKKRVIAYEEDLIDQNATIEKDALVDPILN